MKTFPAIAATQASKSTVGKFPSATMAEFSETDVYYNSYSKA